MSLIQVWVSDHLENVLFGKWQLANKFSVSKFNCDGNTLPSVREKKSSMYLLKTLLL